MHRLEAIIERYGGALARVAASYEADRELQEDLVQEILLAIHGALPDLRDPSRLGPYVFRIAHNRGVTHIARQRAMRRRPDIGGDVDAPATPEQLLLGNERTRRLAAAIRRLPLPYRQVITLVLEDLPYATIAETLGISVSNVAVRVSRAKAMLKEMLQ